MRVESNFGHAPYIGWWWGVWQDDRLVAFGSGYQRKSSAFKQERLAKQRAMEAEMPAVTCTNPFIVRRKDRW